MKKVYFILTFILIGSALIAQEYAPIRSARVTYLANSGFIVQAGSQKVLFDGLFQNGMNRYLEPDTKTIEAIRNATAPFDDLKYAFVSNYMADHFDPFLASQFMLNNTSVKLVCPQQVINKMKIFTNIFPQIENRIIEVTPNQNKYDRLVLDGDEILACHVKHEKIINDHVENIAYMVKINGVKLFHSGDASPETLEDLNGVVMADLGIDIAFLSDKFGIKKGAKITNEIVDARYNILMHFDKNVSPRILELFSERTKLQPKPQIFMARNEYQDFYLNDFNSAEFFDNSLSSVVHE